MSGAATLRGGLIAATMLGCAACGAATATTPPAQPVSPAASGTAKLSVNSAAAADWREVSVANRPLARNSAGFAYDAANQTVVLSGGRHGCGPSATSYSDTWILDGSTWHIPAQKQVRTPGEMATFSMAYDPDVAKVIALGVFSGCGVQTGMMSWNGVAWQPSPDGLALPSPMFSRVLAFDTATHELIAFGFGQTACTAGCPPNGGPETWAYNGATWSQLHPAQSPPGLDEMAMAYDIARHELVLFGGETHNINGTTGVAVNNTWVFDGTTWTQLAPPTVPSARVGASMVFDQALGRIILFGGASSNPDATSASPTVFDDMWTFDGTTWQQLHPATIPSGRFLAQMTYDDASQQIVLFGGALNTTSDANDTWTFGAH